MTLSHLVQTGCVLNGVTTLCGHGTRNVRGQIACVRGVNSALKTILQTDIGLSALAPVLKSRAARWKWSPRSPNGVLCSPPLSHPL